MTAVVIRDPVHGDIALTDAEKRVLDTRDMQRLRGIKQTGTAYPVSYTHLTLPTNREV